VLELPDLGERLADAGDPDSNRVHPRGLVALETPRRLGNTDQRRDGEQEPPDRDAEKRVPGGLRGIGEPETLGPGDPREVHREEQPSTDVADGVARGGDAIDLLGRGDVR